MSSQPSVRRGFGATPLWRDERFLQAAAQVASAALIIGLLIWIVTNLVDSANQRGLSLGFDFLDQAAGFPIGEGVIPYHPSDSFIYAFWVGVLNTIKVAVVGILLTTGLGTLVGLARLSTNWLISRLALVYIELHRNIPVLVILFIWYFAVFTQLPRVRDSIVFPGPVFLNQRGLYMTWPHLSPTGGAFVAAFVIALIVASVAWLVLRSIRLRTGRRTYFAGVSAGLLIVITGAGWLIADGRPLVFDVPELQGFNFTGGLALTPEFAALLIGLVTYTAAFIAEVVRAGIQSVDKGQMEAARAIGLGPTQLLWLVIIPQALRVIIPPLISQYLNLTKNSSLALAIGYPELFTVGRIMINQAGRAIPVFVMIMAAYLVMSLLTSLILNIYNRRIQRARR